MKNKAVLAMLMVLAVTAASCGEERVLPADTQTQAGETESGSYDFPDVDYGGYEFVILNADEQFNTYCHLDHQTLTGESLDDAVYERNRMVEDLFNFTFIEYEQPFTQWSTGQVALVDAMITDITAGDNGYDAGYLPVSFKPSVITDGYLMNLRDIPELRLGEAWWDNVINDALTVNDKLYTASSPLNLMGFGLTWTLLFNETMMTDRNMTFPYDPVRDGKWTLDRFEEYVKESASLNGDESFAWDPAGSSVYGIAGHTDMPASIFYSCGEPYMARTSDGFFEFTVENERFYSIADKIAAIFTLSDGSVRFENSDTEGGYINMFGSDRSMFITCELKATLELRDMDSQFGLIPVPKYDEAQESYLSYMNFITCFLTIPVTQQDPARTGVILDGLSYVSSQNVLPEYYNVTVSQKGLRNENSIEMMEIINGSRGVEFSQVTGITSALHLGLNAGFTTDNSNPASVIAANKDNILTKAAAVFDSFR